MKIKEENVPVLRFPGFEGEWRSGILGDCIISLDAGVSVLSSDKPAQDNQKGILKTSCVTLGTFIPVENKAVKDRGQIQRLKEPVTGKTIIISRMNTPALVGANAFVEEGIANLYLPDRLWAAKIKKSYAPKWVAILTSSSKLRAAFSARATGTSNSMKNITKGDVKTVPVFYPSFDEQKKIASFLTAVDSKIKQLSKKKALLEQYKKGMMQKLFSQELRFKDEQGNEFPDWEEKRLGDVVVFVKNGTTANQNSRKEGIKVTRIETISKNKIDLNRVGYADSSQDLSKYKLQVGDLLFSHINSVAHIGRTVMVDKDYDLYHGMNLLNIRIDNEICSSLFMHYVLTSHQYKCYFERICNKAVNQASINQTDLKKTILNLPVLAEQHKIANFLSSIDKKITLISTELNHSQSFKKSLLQQMFI